MTFAQSGSSITQSGTDTDFSDLTGTTGVTTITVGDVTLYIIASNNLVITGTASIDPLTEMVFVTSTTLNPGLYINGGTLNIGSAVTPSVGTGLKPLYPPATAFVLGGESTGATAAYGISVTSSGTLNWYGGIISVNGSSVWADGATIKIRDGVLYSRRFSTNNRIRCNEGTNIDIDGFTTYGIQLDWLVTETFGKFINYKALDKGVPTENATGTQGTRAWREMPDTVHAVDGLMNNWNGAHDVIVTLAEVGSRNLIMPDNCDGTGGTSDAAHGGRIYHEFTVNCFDVLNAPIEDALCYIADYDNGQRATTTTGPSNISDGDQVLTPATGASGATSLQTLLLATWYRLNDVGDLVNPDGYERVDYRGKPRAVLCAIGSVSGVSATFSSSDSSLPVLLEGDRFVLENSTSNEDQIWETTEDWTAAGGDADRLVSNATAESENAMNMSVLGEDFYDVYVWAYGSLPYKFTDAQMNGLSQLDLIATLSADLGITQATEATVAAYTTIDDLSELYDRQKSYKVNTANLTKPSIDTPIALASGELVDLGDIALIIDGDAASAFVYTSGSPNTVTIKTTDFTASSKFSSLTTTEYVTLQDGAELSGNITINGDLNLADVTDLTDVTVNGDLTLQAAGTYDFSNVTVTGDTTNSSAGAVTVNLTDGSSLTTTEPGTGNGQVNIINSVPIKVTVKDASTLALIQGARVYIKTEAGGPASAGVEIINETTDAAGEVNTTMNYEGDQPVSGTVRKGTE